LGIFAFPLACTFEGVRRQLGVVLSLVFFLLYYSVFSIGLSTGESGKIPPVVGLWLPNALFALTGGIGLFLIGRERTPSIGSFLQMLREKRQRNKGKQDDAADAGSGGVQ
jgi:lipopolysaccharide export system permease protein